MPESKSQQNVEEVIKIGNQIYDSLQQTQNIEKLHLSKYIAVEVNSREYFIGETRDDAVKNARLKYPSQILFVRKIGDLEKVARNYPSSASHTLKYARVF